MQPTSLTTRVALEQSRAAKASAGRGPVNILSACCRHYTDLLLIAVVALCTVENDVIHAAYLAIALLLFRRRDALRTERQGLFKWLPLYNFLVMLITLAYQAPFNSTWDSSLRPYLVSMMSAQKGLPDEQLLTNQSSPQWGAFLSLLECY